MEQSERKERVPNKSALQENDDRTSVGKYPNTADYPLEVGDTVWLLAPSLRAVLGEYRITNALPNDEFELEKVDDGTPHPGPVEGKYLRRDPYAAN